jgi:hypothetical protein
MFALEHSCAKAWTMKSVIAAIAMLSIFFGPVSADPKTASDNAVLQPFTTYLAGIELIDNDHKLDSAAKAKQYRRLCSLTGFNALSAIKMIEGYKSRPEAWQKIQESLVQILQSIK